MAHAAKSECDALSEVPPARAPPSLHIVDGLLSFFAFTIRTNKWCLCHIVSAHDTLPMNSALGSRRAQEMRYGIKPSNDYFFYRVQNVQRPRHTSSDKCSKNKITNKILRCRASPNRKSGSEHSERTRSTMKMGGKMRRK